MENVNYYNVEAGHTATITMDDLRRSRSSMSSFGKVNQVQFMEAIASKIEASGMKYKYGDIFYSNNRGRNPGLELLDINQEHETDREELAPIEVEGVTLHHPRLILFKRLIGNIKLLDYQNDEMIGVLAFTVSQNGYQIAVGEEVKTCSNMCIMNAEHQVSTFGGNKVSIDKMTEQLDKWINGYSEIHETNIDIINKMKAIDIDIAKANTIFGNLYRAAVMNNNPKLKKLASKNMVALNQSIITRGQAHYIQETLINGRHNTSLWDLANDITENHKPHNVDTINILNENAMLMEHFKTLI